MPKDIRESLTDNLFLAHAYTIEDYLEKFIGDMGLDSIQRRLRREFIAGHPFEDMERFHFEKWYLDDIVIIESNFYMDGTKYGFEVSLH